MPKLRLVLDSDELFQAQAKCGSRIKSMEAFNNLSERDQELVLEFLRDYCKMLQGTMIRDHYCPEEERPPEPQYPKGRLHEEVPAASYVGYMDKDKALAMFKVKHKEVFGRELKQEA